MSSSMVAPSYRAVLRTPFAFRTFTMALVGRLSYGTVFLSLVLALTDATGSFAMAGGAIALFGLTSSLLSPLRAHLIDRHGVRKALPPMAVAYALALAVIAALTWRPGIPGVALWSLAGVAGALTPPLGPIMRTLWSELLGDDEALLQRAYSLDTVAEELLYVTGPLIAGVLAGLVAPALGIAVSAVLVFVGALGLVLSPAVCSGPPSPEPSDAAPGLDGMAKRGSLFADLARLRRPVLVTAGVGMCLGALNLLVVAFAEEHGRLAAVAWVEAALATGSAIGGLLYGTVTWRIGLERRLLLMTVALATALATAGLAPNLPVLALLVAVTGLFVSPVLTASYVLADKAATSGARTQAGAWVNTAFNTGHSAGSASVGLLIGNLALAGCFAVSAAAPLLGVLASLNPSKGPPTTENSESANG
ncbi:MFS transporter [Actinomadura terrae]|uniref:MFS transporter n=1 Tax=Actinomadura terrae TaxID=604353 RepID=UPI001FA724D4|nr:MFS transporter [Actinomadura terrae]